MSERDFYESLIQKIIQIKFTSTNVKLYKKCCFFVKLWLVLLHENKTMKNLLSQIHHHHSCKQAS